VNRPAKGEAALSAEDRALLDQISARVVRMGMATPAVFFLESVKPLSFVGSQVLIFFEPFVRAFFTLPDYERFARLMEDREAIEALLVRIERGDEELREKERAQKVAAKAEKKAAKEAARRTERS
jgi:hypothetical protein